MIQQWKMSLITLNRRLTMIETLKVSKEENKDINNSIRKYVKENWPDYKLLRAERVG